MDRISDLLIALRAEFNRWQTFLAGLSEAQATIPQPDGLSIRDVVGHLHAWQQLSVARLEAAQSGGEPVYPDWCSGLYPDDEEYIEQFNATIHETYRQQSWPHVYELWRDGFVRFLTLAESTPASDLVDKTKYPWLRGYALLDVMQGLYEHHVEHFESLSSANSCMTCELIARRDAGEAPLWDAIARTAYWDVAHSYNTSLPGWLVLIARRHITSIDELTPEEAVELGILLRQTSAALREVVGCLKTYVCQFAEAAEHPHVHFHVIPRMADQPDERRGPRVFGYMGVPEEEEVSEDRMNEIAAMIRRCLSSGDASLSTTAR